MRHRHVPKGSKNTEPGFTEDLKRAEKKDSFQLKNYDDQQAFLIPLSLPLRRAQRGES